MSELSSRLKEVRERMTLTQTEFGALGGVSKGSQIAYERGRAQPAVTYLQRLAESGVNVIYLLTGQKMIPLDPRDDFYALMRVYEQLGETHRREILMHAQALYGSVVLNNQIDDEWLAHGDAVMRALREGEEPPAPLLPHSTQSASGKAGRGTRKSGSPRKRGKKSKS